MRKSAMLAALMMLGLAQPTAAQQQVNVRWVATARDQLGMALSTRVRERLASSPLFTLIYREDQSALVVHFVTINPDGNSNQLQTTYALVINIKFGNDTFERYIDTLAGVCGGSRIPQCADSIIASIDSYADTIRSAGAR